MTIGLIMVITKFKIRRISFVEISVIYLRRQKKPAAAGCV
jgi:hypothetical protein